MGLFSFVGDIGDKIFGSEDEAPEKIKQHIEKDNPGVKNLDVQVSEGVATLSGQASSADAKEKAILMAGNVKGISQVNGDAIKSPAPVQQTQYYEIKPGDTLSAIAKNLLGSAGKYQEIFEANREVIKDPNLIYPGQKIRIPKQVEEHSI